MKKVKKNLIAFEKIKNPARGIGERLHKRASVQLRPLLALSQSNLVLFLHNRVLVYGGAKRRHLYQDKHTSQCHSIVNFEKRLIF